MIGIDVVTSTRSPALVKERPRPIGTLQRPEISASVLNGSSGDSYNNEAAKRLAMEIGKSKNHRATLEKIANPNEFGSGQDINRLAQLSKEASIRKWGVCKSEQEFHENMKTWENQMEKWYQNLNHDRQLQLELIMKNIGIVPEDKIYNWNELHAALFSNGKVDLVKFINAVKEVPDFKTALPVAKDLAGIFGPEVTNALFERKSPKKLAHERIIQNARAEEKIDLEKDRNRPGDAWNNHIDQRKNVVEKAYREGKIDDQKKEKYISYLEGERSNNERVLNFDGVKYEGFTHEQQEQIKEAVKMLPQELIYHIKEVKTVNSSELLGKGVMCYSGKGKYEDGVVGIAPETFGYDEATFMRKVLHEIGGHGLRDMVQALNPELHKQLLGLWSQTITQHQGLLMKDTYSKGILDGTIFKDNLRYGDLIYASVDEFMCDRMAERFYAEAMKRQGSQERVYSNRDITDPFTQVEEAAVQRVCEQTYQIWKQAVEQAGLAISPKSL